MSALTITIQHRPEVLAKVKKQAKNKQTESPDWQGRGKTVFTYR